MEKKIFRVLKKKGIFFTFIAVTLIAAILIIFKPGQEILINKDASSTKTRITKINDYIIDLKESYFESVLRISSHKAILAMISYMESNDQFFASVQDIFPELVLEGKINGIPQIIMDENTIKDFLDGMVIASKNVLNVNSEFSVNSVKIYEIKPWYVQLEMDISFNVSSESSIWNVENFIVSTELSILRFEDPYYLLNTNGAYRNIITKTNTSFNEWNVQKVKDHIRNGTYVHFTDKKSPSFLMRFENNIVGSDCCGIESIVNPNRLSVSNQMESYTDYLFFEHTFQGQCSELYKNPDLESEFPNVKFDFEHLSQYKITSGSSSVC